MLREKPELDVHHLFLIERLVASAADTSGGDNFLLPRLPWLSVDTAGHPTSSRVVTGTKPHRSDPVITDSFVI